MPNKSKSKIGQTGNKWVYALLMAFPLLHFCVFYVYVNANSIAMAFQNVNPVTGEIVLVFSNFAEQFKFLATGPALNMLRVSLLGYVVHLVVDHGGIVCILRVQKARNVKHVPRADVFAVHHTGYCFCDNLPLFYRQRFSRDNCGVVSSEGCSARFVFKQGDQACRHYILRHIRIFRYVGTYVY